MPMLETTQLAAAQCCVHMRVRGRARLLPKEFDVPDALNARRQRRGYCHLLEEADDLLAQRRHRAVHLGVVVEVAPLLMRIIT